MLAFLTPFQQPKFGFSQAPRVPEQKPKYDFYENALFLDDPIVADNNRRERCCAPKIGTEPRMQNGIHDNANPGPQYLVKERPEVKSAPKYTFGFKRGAGGGLKNETSTPAAVGPGRYVPEHAANPSTKQNMPRWTLPKAPRPEAAIKKFDKHQTYDSRSGFGGQCHSKNRTSQKAHFGSSDRDGRQKLGVFSDQFRGGASVRIQMPKW